MKPFTRLVLFAVLVLGVVLVPAAARSVAAQLSPVLVDRAGGVYNGVEVTLTADAPVVPGGVVSLTLTARPLQGAPNLYVEWTLPDGGTLLDGPTLENLGPATAGQTVSVTRRARFETDGIYAVQSKAYYAPNQGRTLAALGVLFFTVADRPTVTELDPRTAIYEPPARRLTVDKSYPGFFDDFAALGGVVRTEA